MAAPPQKGVSQMPAHQRSTRSSTQSRRSAAPVMAPIPEPGPTQAPSKIAENQSAPSPERTPLQEISHSIAVIITELKLEGKTKELLERVITFAKEAEAKEKMHEDPSWTYVMLKAIKTEVSTAYTSITTQLNSIQDTANESLSASDKLQKEVEAIKSSSFEMDRKVGKITDTADKIAVTTSSYRDTVLSKPAHPLRADSDPKISGDLDRKAKQILVEIWDKEGADILAKSLTEIKDKANEAITSIKDCRERKP